MGSRAVQHPMRLTLPFLSRDAFDWQDDWSPRFNIAPMQPVPVIQQHPKEPVRQISTMRWGFIPNWARDASIASGTISAKFETVANKPAFRDPLRLVGVGSCDSFWRQLEP